MTTSEHTPAPWQANIGQPYDSIDVSGDGNFICEINTSEAGYIGRKDFEESKANALLIAAAPELLEALIEVEQMIHANELNEGTMAIVREAIAKAIGEA